MSKLNVQVRGCKSDITTVVEPPRLGIATTDYLRKSLEWNSTHTVSGSFATWTIARSSYGFEATSKARVSSSPTLVCTSCVHLPLSPCHLLFPLHVSPRILVLLGFSPLANSSGPCRASEGHSPSRPTSCLLPHGRAILHMS